MTSKEALSNIIDNWKVGEDNFNSFEKRQLLLSIEKDLEVLEIFRRRAYQCVEVKSNTLNYTIDSLNSDEYDKVKEWLKNES